MQHLLNFQYLGNYNKRKRNLCLKKTFLCDVGTHIFLKDSYCTGVNGKVPWLKRVNTVFMQVAALQTGFLLQYLMLLPCFLIRKVFDQVRSTE